MCLFLLRKKYRDKRGNNTEIRERTKQQEEEKNRAKKETKQQRKKTNSVTRLQPAGIHLLRRRPAAATSPNRRHCRRCEVPCQNRPGSSLSHHRPDDPRTRPGSFSSSRRPPISPPPPDAAELLPCVFRRRRRVLPDPKSSSFVFFVENFCKFSNLSSFLYSSVS